MDLLIFILIMPFLSWQAVEFADWLWPRVSFIYWDAWLIIYQLNIWLTEKMSRGMILSF